MQGDDDRQGGQGGQGGDDDRGRRTDQYAAPNLRDPNRPRRKRRTTLTGLTVPPPISEGRMPSSSSPSSSAGGAPPPPRHSEPDPGHRPPRQRRPTGVDVLRASAPRRPEMSLPAPPRPPGERESTLDYSEAPMRQHPAEVSRVGPLTGRERFERARVANTPRRRAARVRVGRTPLKRATWIVVSMLAVAALLPDGRAGSFGGPWAQWIAPGSPGFVALCCAVLVALAGFFPMADRTRAAWSSVTGVVVFGFGLLAASAAAGGGTFGGQPTLQSLLAGGSAARAVVVMGAVSLLTALYWRRESPGSLGARIVIGCGVALVLFAYFGLGAMGLGGGVPLAAIFDSATSAVHVGDQVAAWVALLPLVFALMSLVALRPAQAGGLELASALLFWGSTVAVLLTLGLFAAGSERWVAAVEPVRVTLLVGAGLLLLPSALGGLLARLTR